MAFEVASVKLAKPGTFVFPTFWLDAGDAKPPGGRLSASFSLSAYIFFAYKLDPSEFESMRAQLPKWAIDQDYVIDAKAESNPTKDQMRLMMQSLLADRFKLRVHFESRDGPVLALTLVKPGKLGSKLHPHSEGPPCPDSFEMPKLFAPIPPAKADVFPSQCELALRGTSDGTWIGGRNTTIGLLAGNIYAYGSTAGEVDKPVVDQTGLEGTFDFVLEVPPGVVSFPGKSPNLNPPNLDNPLTDPKGTPFLNAVRDQLGLKLVRSRGEVRMLIIDHVEKPSEN